MADVVGAIFVVAGVVLIVAAPSLRGFTGAELLRRPRAYARARRVVGLVSATYFGWIAISRVASGAPAWRVINASALAALGVYLVISPRPKRKPREPSDDIPHGIVRTQPQTHAWVIVVLGSLLLVLGALMLTGLMRVS